MALRAKNINLSPIKSIELLASKIPDVISLAQGIPSFDTPEIVKKAAIKALNRGTVSKYSLTCGLPELREIIEQKLADEGMYYDFENEILVSAGSIEAITATLISIINNKKNEIILFSPSYASYSEAVKIAGGKPVFVELAEDDGWKIDFKKLEKRICPETAAILICNPNNPTGTIFSKDDLFEIADIAQKKKIFIISDEVYKDFIYNEDDSSLSRILTGKGGGEAGYLLSPEKKFESGFFTLGQIPALRKSVIRIFSLSKAYAMTGWRIGFLHSDEENVKEILKVHDSLITCAPVISQYAAMAALDFGDREIEKFRQEFQSRRDLICRYLNDLPDIFSYQKPKGSYFVFPKILSAKYKDSWQFSLNLLNQAKIAVVPGIAFGPSGESHIRMSFGRSKNDIGKAFERLKDFLRKH